MKLKVNFISKTPKVATANEIIFVKNKNIKNKNLNPILKKFLTVNYLNHSYLPKKNIII